MEVLACLVPGIYVAYTDWTKRIINNFITFPLIILGLLYTLAVVKTTAGLWGFLFAAVTLGLVYVLRGVGGGDVKLAAAFGAWFGFPNIVFVLLIGSLLTFIFGSIALVRKGRWKQTMLPFLRSIWMKAVYDKSVPLYAEKLPEEGIHPDAQPFGIFLVVGGWLWFVFLVVEGGII